jgi:hypothetical protein
MGAKRRAGPKNATTAAKNPERITGHDWDMLHAAFVTPPPEDNFHVERPTVAALARTFGLPVTEAEQRAAQGDWELERNAGHTRAWLGVHGHEATTEAEFIERRVAAMYGHLVAQGPEGERMARAIARKTWVHVHGDLLRWEAAQELRAARVAHEVAEVASRCSCRCHERAAA